MLNPVSPLVCSGGDFLFLKILDNSAIRNFVIMHKNYFFFLKGKPVEAHYIKQNCVQKLTYTAIISAVLFSNQHFEKKNHNSTFLNFVGFCCKIRKKSDKISEVRERFGEVCGVR